MQHVTMCPRTPVTIRLAVDYQLTMMSFTITTTTFVILLMCSTFRASFDSDQIAISAMKSVRTLCI